MNVQQRVGAQAVAQPAKWNRYVVKAADIHRYRVRDWVSSAGGSNADGLLYVTLAAGNDMVRGQIAAIDPASPTNGLDANNVRLTVPSTKVRDYIVWVNDDPRAEFTWQDDGAVPGNLVPPNVGMFCDFLPNESAGGDISAAALSSQTFASGSAMQILGLAYIPGNTVGPFATWRVRVRLHELAEEPPGLTFSDFGGPDTIASLRSFSDASQVHKVGHSVLVAGASTNARAHNEYPVQDLSSYSRTATGQVQFDCQAFPDADTGRRIHLAANNVGDIDCIANVISGTPISGGLTRIIAQEQLFGLAPRRAIGAGSVAGTSLFCHDMQSCGNAESWMAKLEAKLGAVCDFYNMGCGGSVPADWNDPSRRAYIEAMARSIGFDTLIADVGIGNSFTDPSASTESIVAETATALTWLSACARQCIFRGISGARPGGDDHLVPSPQLTPDFTTAQRASHYFRQFLAEQFPTWSYADIASACQRYSLRGSVDTPDLLTGRISNRLTGSDGIHESPAVGDVISETLFDLMAPIVAKWQPFGMMHVDFVYAAPVPDVGGRFVQGGVLGWHGATPTTPVSVPGVGAIGTGIENTIVSASGLNSTMTAALSVELGECRGRVMRLVFTDADPTSAGGALLVLQSPGPTAYPIVQMLNDPKFSGPVDAWIEFGCWGFAPDSVARIELELYGVTATGTRMIAAWLSDKGANGMFGAQRGWTKGFSREPFRAGCGQFMIPQREVYTSGFVQLKIQGTPGLRAGLIVAELGDFALRARQQILA